jgi:hypothetical protein
MTCTSTCTIFQKAITLEADRNSCTKLQEIHGTQNESMYACTDPFSIAGMKM